MASDDRILVIFGSAALAQSGDVVLLDRVATIPAGIVAARFSPQGSGALHAIGCICCGGRSPAAVALAGLFAARARGQVEFFRRVIADVRDEALVRGQLADDVLVRARFIVA